MVRKMQSVGTHVARSVVCVSVCLSVSLSVLGTRVSCVHMSHVAWSVCLSVCLCCLCWYEGKLCQNGRTAWDAIWGLTRMGSQNHVLDGGQCQFCGLYSLL